MNRSNNAKKGRRRFLQGSALAGVAVLAAAGGETLTPQDTNGRPGAARPADDGKARGYRVTPHIEAYYRSTRD